MVSADAWVVQMLVTDTPTAKITAANAALNLPFLEPTSNFPSSSSLLIVTFEEPVDAGVPADLAVAKG
ncbi:hypothetical protein [Glycomyces buryatensis]|uniref:Uncharacterized protein n=1 Tax=Glycomyces buryatensis TaxID=2570927 RepID=A0A4S8Q851_9ACTN|nr:hypothetical protein [Glycomyces buryatensis]THV40553.1 hypothetical protein FAB82_14905 [Glycomyces buryatensis]